MHIENKCTMRPHIDRCPTGADFLQRVRPRVENSSTPPGFNTRCTCAKTVSYIDTPRQHKTGNDQIYGAIRQRQMIRVSANAAYFLRQRNLRLLQHQFSKIHRNNARPG